MAERLSHVANMSYFCSEFPSRPSRNYLESLIIVAGASCAGKTTFLRRLQQTGPELLPRGLRPSDLSECLFCNAMDLDSRLRTGPQAGTIFLHYDIFRPITFYGTLDFESDPALSIMGHASNLAIVTLWEDPAVLRERSRRRKRSLWKKFMRRPMIRRFPENCAAYRSANLRRARMKPWLDSPDRIRRLYDEWFRFCSAKHIANHWIATPSEGQPPRYLGTSLPQTPFRRTA